ncbi:DUF2079 domain-containing protein [Actinoplanes sp. NPDC051494]|uniref:DUF2079 domain-containing protein n=1 Tax=Actinoplanes sp. NPDC051494 TaxID=3363907 RepID=UPI0037B4EEAA
MSVAEAVPEVIAADPPAPAQASRGSRLGRLVDVVYLLFCLGAGYWVTSQVWADPARRSVQWNGSDHAFFEWLLGYGVQIVRHGANPFYTDLLNSPVGVNLAANTSITVLAVLFAPLTYVAGPPITYVTILTLNLAMSAVVWYAFLRRHLVEHRAAAVIGGLFLGFAPGWISHANGHLNWTAGWLVPAILWWVIRLYTSRRWILNGLVLGLLVAAGFTVAAELLFFTAVATAVFIIAWAPSRATFTPAMRAAPRAFAALAVCAGVAGTLLAYPLYMHFSGPGSFKGTGFLQGNYVEDAASYFSYPERSIAGFLGYHRGDLAANPSEAASFFGPGLLVLVTIGTAVLWWRADRARKALLRALTVVGLLFTALSLGPHLNWYGTVYDNVELPYGEVMDLPFFDSALPSRLALIVVCVIGVTLALLADRVFTRRGHRLWSRVVWGAAFAAALVPIIPTPLMTDPRSAEPRFIADGTWKQYAKNRDVVTALPFASNAAIDAQRWQAYTMARGGKQFEIPDGYFLGPGGENGTGRLGGPSYYANNTFLRAARIGYRDKVDNFDRARVREDLTFWNVKVMYIPDEISGPNGILFRAALVNTVTELFGPGERVQDVLLWRVRPGIDPQSLPGDGGEGSDG